MDMNQVFNINNILDLFLYTRYNLENNNRNSSDANNNEYDNDNGILSTIRTLNEK